MKINLFGIPVEVKSTAEIHEAKCPLVAVRVTDALPMENYPPGTKGGFPCTSCGEDCILAPSGQEIVSAGVNPVLCMTCMFAREAARKGGNKQ